ncbi:MAG: glycosyltransferase family 39 protein, partial [Pseudonocardiaceae bacterium]
MSCTSSSPVRIQPGVTQTSRRSHRCSPGRLPACSGDSLVALRLPSALAIAAVVVLTALLAREFGARPGSQLLAAGCTAVSAYVIAVGHLLSTATFDLLAWTTLSWLLARALRRGGPVWLAAGLVAGIGLQNKTLLASYLAALGVALLVV